MNNFKIISDSACDLKQEYFIENEIDIIPFYVTIDGVNYLKEQEEIEITDFYKQIEEDSTLFPKTSLPPITDYIDKFEKYLSQNMDILFISLSSTLSGACQTSINAREILLEKYPDRKISIVDSRGATGLQGLLVEEVVKMKTLGFNINEIEKIANVVKYDAKVTFTIGNLDYLKKGGRIGGASAMVGTLLNIKPLITVVDGTLTPIGKVRGEKKVLKEIVETFKKDMENKEYKLKMIRCGAKSNYEDLKALLDENNLKYEDDVVNLGVVTVSHVGPTGIGLCYIKSFTEEELRSLL